jgi:orotate phosphoribosyltransferase
VIESVERVREAGLEVATALVLVDREEGGAQAIAATGVPFQAICTVSQIRALRDTAPPADARERRA